MRSHQPSGRDTIAAGDHPDRAHAWPWRWRSPPVPVRALGYAAAWCLGFAGVSAWQVAADLIGPPDVRQRYTAYASGLAIMGMLVLVLKLAGAAMAMAAVLVRPGRPRRPRQLLGVALWGAFGLLGLYSAGNLFITIGTVSGLLAPSAAWTAAGGVTTKAIGYVLFFLAGAALFGMLAVWFHRRHQLRWTSAVAGAGRSAAAAWAAPGGGTRDPRPVGPAAHLTALRAGPTSRREALVDVLRKRGGRRAVPRRAPA